MKSLFGKQLILYILLALGCSSQVQAEVKADASLSQPRVQLGSAVQLSIKVEGSRDVGEPPQINVSGLQTQFQGRSVQFQMINFDVRFITEFQYSIIPERAGVFTIPALEIEAGGDIVQTTPLRLEVTGAGGINPPPQAQGGGSTSRRQPQATREQSTREGDLFFAELIAPKKSAYIGETVPVEIRMYFDARIDYNIEGLPEFDSPNFTARKFGDPRRDRVNRNGRIYDVMNFRTIVTPVKSGATELGPVKTDALVRIPQQRPRNRDSFFEDFFNNSPFSRARTQRIRLVAEPVAIEIKDLPVAGQPDSFAGAVGNFDLKVDVANNETSIGSPLTVQAVVSGKGDFDRVNAPVLSDPDGWRTYPPSSDLTPTDDLGITGTKTFQLLAIPERNHQLLPPLEFAYFDPQAEEYQILRSEPMPVEVRGSPAVLPPQQATAPGGQVANTATAQQQPQTSQSEQLLASGERDLLHIITEPQEWGGQFLPLYLQRSFWMWQLAALAVLLAAGTCGLLIKRNSNEQHRSQQAQRRELAKLKAVARDASLGESERNKSFTEWLRLQTEAVYRRPAALVDSRVATSSRPQLHEEVVNTISRAFSRYEELFFSGQQGLAAGNQSSIDYNELIRKIESYDTAKN